MNTTSEECNATLENNKCENTNEYPYGLRLVLLVFLFLVSVFILFSNGFVLLFLYKLKYNKMKKRLSMILSLCFSDLVIGFSGLLVTAIRLLEQYTDIPVPGGVCATILFFVEFGVTSSLFHTFCICIARFAAVRSKIFRNDIFDERRRCYTLVISWIVIGLFFICLKIVTPQQAPACTLITVYNRHYKAFLLVLTFAIWIPMLFVTIVIYCATFGIIRSKLSKVDCIDSSRVSDICKTTHGSQQNISFIFDTSGRRSQVSSFISQNAVSSRQENILDNATSTREPIELHFSDGKENILNNTTNKENNAQQSQVNVQNNVIKSQEIVLDNAIQGQDMLQKSDLSQIHILHHTIIRRFNSKTKAIKIVGVIVLTLVFTTGIGVAVLAVEAACANCYVSDQLRHITTLLWFVNSALNPFIYICGIRDFRQAFIKTFAC